MQLEPVFFVKVPIAEHMLPVTVFASITGFPRLLQSEG
jgi:hypothetical protein